MACFLTQLPSACRNGDGRISTKNHRFWRVFFRNYVRCVEILKLEFRRKTIDSGVLFAAIMFGVSFFFRGGILATVSTVVIVAERRF